MSATSAARWTARHLVLVDYTDKLFFIFSPTIVVALGVGPSFSVNIIGYGDVFPSWDSTLVLGC